jgi:hypothetical protein
MTGPRSCNAAKGLRSASVFLVLAGLAAAWVVIEGGNLEPPGSPAPTMATLEEIDDRLDGFGPQLKGVPQTGQTECWDAAGIEIDCAGTGQDGEFLMGVSLTPRFTDNGDGTVTDNLTSLVWLQTPCLSPKAWDLALVDANTLATGSCGLTDGSVAGDWRLPNVRELQSLIDYSTSTPATPPGQPFGFIWTSTSNAADPSWAWAVYSTGISAAREKFNGYNVWPVRGGP